MMDKKNVMKKHKNANSQMAEKIHENIVNVQRYLHASMDVSKLIPNERKINMLGITTRI